MIEGPLESPNTNVRAPKNAKSCIAQWGVVALWLLFAAAVLPLAGSIEGRLNDSTQIRGSQSQLLDHILAEKFAAPFANSMTLVIAGVPTPSDAAGQQALELLIEQLEQIEGIGRIVSYLTSGDPIFLSETGSGTFAFVEIEIGEQGIEETIGRIRAWSSSIEAVLGPTHSLAKLTWTGEPVLNIDLRRWGTQNAEEAEIKALPVVGILLVVTFGSLVAASLPIGTGLLAITIATAVIAAIAPLFPASTVVLNIVTMVGLGISIDYALLTVSRFRDELQSGATAAEAAISTAHHARRTIAISAVAVMIGFAAMLISPIGELRSIAVGGMVVVAVVLAINTTLLPAVLRIIGPRINMVRIGLPVVAPVTQQFWRFWAQQVVRRPVVILGVSLAVLLTLALPIRSINVALPEVSWLPASASSVAAMNQLEGMGRGGVVNTIELVLTMPGDHTASTAVGWLALARVSNALDRDPRIVFVRSAALTHLGPVPSLRALETVANDIAQRYVSIDRRHALIEIIPSGSLTQSEIAELSREIMDTNWLRGVAPEAELVAGGLPIFNVEYEDKINDQFVLVVSLVTLATFLALAFWFKSVLVPLKAVVLSLLSVGAGIGAMVLVFQQGFLHEMVAIDGPTGAIFPIIPLLTFAITFGLSMDYEVFLVSRVMEARRAGIEDNEALALALESTGNVITSAAMIMIAVFGAFVLGDFLLIKMLGFALAITVFLDATVVRLGLGPAILILGGRWNWWPGTAIQDQTDNEGR